jgi:hypothetical protein
MACCGIARSSTGRTRSALEASAHAPPRIRFAYVGRTALSVIGGATGRQYRFDGPGAELEVDARDAPGLATIPVLEERRQAPARAERPRA